MRYDKIKQVIIYGHKNNHTHSYIHSSYYKTFKRMGYKTFWFDRNDNINLDLSGTLFFTEGQVDENIPLRSDCYYVLHHCNLDKYIYKNCKYVQLGNYLQFCVDNKNHYYPGYNLTKISEQVYFDSFNKLLYQMWATDVYPDDIDENDFLKYDNSLDKIYYVGTIWNENDFLIRPFVDTCNSNGKQFISKLNVSDDEHRELIRLSYICPDIRGNWHKECGYIPCRIFKNISYGKMTGTNSKHVFEIFDGMVPYAENIEDLFSICSEFSKNVSDLKIKQIINFVKSNHTYVNRINTILNVIGDFYG